MGSYITYGHSLSSTPPNFATILGANYYEDWNSEIGVADTSGLVNSWTSQGLNGGVFAIAGADRPSIVADATLGKDVLEFDGVNEYLHITGSTADYNFLHGGKGCVIMVFQFNAAITSTEMMFSNAFSSADDGIIISGVNSNTVRSSIANSSGFILNDVNIGTDAINYNSKVIVFDSQNTTVLDKIYDVINGTTEKNNTSNLVGTLGDSTRILTLGKRAASTSLYYGGTVARIIVADAIPTPTQLTQIQSRLNYEYGTFPIS